MTILKIMRFTACTIKMVTKFGEVSPKRTRGDILKCQINKGSYRKNLKF